MSSKAILAISCGVILAFTACEDDSVSPPPEKAPSWWLEPDSMNLGILVMDFLTYEFEGGRVDHYALCDTCDQDSLPFHVEYNPPSDEGDVTFSYTYTGETILYATQIWMGRGRIMYPREFLPPSNFQNLSWRFASPIGVEYFNNAGKTAPTAEADTAWSRVSSLDVVGEFAKSDYRVGIYRHSAGSGNPRPEENSWVVFLYRGGIPAALLAVTRDGGLIERTPSNQSVNPTVRAVTVRATGARPAPVRPAGYADRSADSNIRGLSSRQCNERILSKGQRRAV